MHRTAPLPRLFALAFGAALIATTAQWASTARAEQTDQADFETVRPLPGLDATRLASFQRGRKLFERAFGPADGLGPIYNNTSCRACHGAPYTGGGSSEAITVVGGLSGLGEQVSLVEEGGVAIQANAVEGVPRERLPADAKYVSTRITPPTFGLGLLEAVSMTDVTAQLAANPLRAALGIRGRANGEYTQLGRFGWKAQKGDLVDFTQQACQFELGLSSPGRPQKQFPNVRPQKLGKPQLYGDPAHPWVKAYFDRRAALGLPMDRPDLTQPQIEDLVAFQRYQAPVAALPLTPFARRGRAVFARVHCDACHVPAFKTGPNAVGVPAGLAVPAYSDLLVHDMGDAESDGLVQGVAKGSMWRTTPLWGLRYRAKLMHDGRSQTLHGCIEEHGGEAAKVRALYEGLSGPERQALLAFLKSL